ncbi:hypothetical protein N8079_00470 [Crocinitomicaceae bacterium]|jgi:hypothetical protein|nr:hypothetical protein [Crocinitomicaceae bacterium]
MEEYVYGKSEMNHDFLIACAAGSNTTFIGNSSLPTSIFYYVEPGAENIHLFSTSKDVSDPEN